jgi:DNA modification methylase
MTLTIYQGDARQVLDMLAPESVDACITSPPYYGLRCYGHDAQIGREDTPEAYVAALVETFRLVRRALKPRGTLWVNLGDSYANQPGGGQGKTGLRASRTFTATIKTKKGPGLKRKDLIGIPWMLAFALRADGWWLRTDIIWHKPNPMPESVKDRPTRAHEYVFLLSKSKHYHYDADAVAEDTVTQRGKPMGPVHGASGRRDAGRRWENVDKRNRRSVWTLTPAQFAGAHFAVMPVELAELCVLAGCPPGGRVLDPFAGTGTTAIAAGRHGRDFVGVELNPEYAAMAHDRIARELQRAPVLA